MSHHLRGYTHHHFVLGGGRGVSPPQEVYPSFRIFHQDFREFMGSFNLSGKFYYAKEAWEVSSSTRKYFRFNNIYFFL